MSGEGKIPIVETFVSVQGEGGNAGRSAAFIRLAGCNLNCTFADGSICDTPWSKPRDYVTAKDLVAWVLHNTHPDTIVIITGGEPTMSPHFDDLVRRLRKERVYVAIETNGTTWRDSLAEANYIVVSPKTDIAQPGIKRDAKPDPRVLAVADEYRYVIAAQEQQTPVVEKGRDESTRHYVSPAMEADGTGMEYVTGTPKFVPGAVARCLQIVDADPRWRLSLQTHKWIKVR